MRSLSLVGVALVLVAGLSSCSGEEPGSNETAPTSTSSAATDQPAATPLVTTASIDRVDGRLAPDARARLRTRVVSTLDTWIDGAYGGSYPRDDFSGAFDGFTQRAARRADRDKDILSNASVGLEVDGVQAVRRRIRLEVLAVEGAAVAVTARVDLAFELSGEITRRDAIVGQLYLTYERPRAASGDSPGWRVFGYDLNRREK